jgi:enoyl-[acyl-carrier-protein] reductase (NADH)
MATQSQTVRACQIPYKRPTGYALLAAVAAFLASERASYVTGGVHLLDGGASVLGHPVTQYTSVPKDTHTTRSVASR